MVKDPILDLCTDGSVEQVLEIRLTQEHLRGLRDQLQRTIKWDRPCIVFEFESLSPLGARIQNYLFNDLEYDSIGIAELSSCFSTRSAPDHQKGSLYIHVELGQLYELAALYETQRYTESNDRVLSWTTGITEKSANSFINFVDKLDEDQNL